MPSRRSKSLGRRLIHFVAFGFGAGYARYAPGTCGTLVAVPIYLLLREFGWLAYALVTLAMFVLGIWLCGVAERDLGKSDAPGIVWDEIVGYLISMFMAPAGWLWVGIGFALFRLFDIVKPFPIGLLDKRIGGGFGVMLDDVLAGIYSWMVMYFIVALLA